MIEPSEIRKIIRAARLEMKARRDTYSKGWRDALALVEQELGAAIQRKQEKLANETQSLLRRQD